MCKNMETHKQGVMNISSKNITNNCVGVLKLLKKSNIECNVSSIMSLTSSENKYDDGRVHWENGCRIEFFNTSSKNIYEKIWKPIQQTFDLNCAYLEYGDYFKGCIKHFKK